MNKTIAAICLTLMVSSCHVGPGVDAERKAASPERPGRDGTWYPALRDRQAGNGVEIAPLSEPRIVGLDLLHQGSPPSTRSIYYANDSYTIDTPYHTLIEAHAQFLHEHPDFRLRIEGNCDERGSTEYNLALGQRRADLVKRALVMLGANAAQITTISLGSQRPKVFGHSEAERSQNRRSDFLYVGIDTR
jgi:peptidoglycan-associated lipoprotein